jgi:TatA/E family protein of Tat protein translocase
MGIENPVHLLFIAAVALVVLGPKRLPELARSLGKGIREFRDAMSDGSTHAGSSHAPAPPVASAAPDQPASPTAAITPHQPAPSSPVAPVEAAVVASSPESAPPGPVDPP